VQPDARKAYFESTVSTGEKPALAPAVLLACVRELIANELVLELPTAVNSETLPAIMQALESCFRVPELRAVLSLLTGKCDGDVSGVPKPSASTLKSMPKLDILASIQSILASQRTLAGTGVQGVPFIASVLREIDGEELGGPGVVSSFPPSMIPIIIRLNANVVVSTSVTVWLPGCNVILSIQCALQALVRRVYRLYYLSSNTGSTSSGGSGNAVAVRPMSNGSRFLRPASTSQRSGASATAIANLNVFAVSSSPLLMSVWKKARYQPVSCNRQSVVFPTRRHVVCYEAAIVVNEELEEFSVAYVQAKRATAKALVPSSTVPASAASSGSHAEVAVEIDVDDEEEDISKRRFTSSKGAVFMFHPAFGYRKDVDACCVGLDLLPALIPAVDTSTTVGSEAFQTISQLFGLPPALVGSGTTPGSEPVPDCVLIAWRASYCLAACADLDTSPDAMTAVDGHVVSQSPIPSFLRQFEPGYCFATAVCDVNVMCVNGVALC
jgi:hypothetical protein